MATTSTSIAQLLGTVATVYGVLAALSVLLQARQMLARRASCEISGRFFASYAGGYAIWLLYGISVSNVPLIVVDTVGLVSAGLTLAVALSLRGSLIHPTTWASCNALPVPESRARRSSTPRYSEIRHLIGSNSRRRSATLSRRVKPASLTPPA